MEVLTKEAKRRPSALAQMFATHPISSERYATARERTSAEYAALAERPRNRERCMDNTARLRRIAPAIEALQMADAALAKRNLSQAESEVQRALKVAPQDYAALATMAKVQLAKGDAAAAKRYAEQAKAQYPSEAQAHHLSGIADLGLKRYEAAMEGFSAYERLLPGNPNTAFLKGVSLEGMNRQGDAAREYHRYLQSVKRGDKAQYAYRRLVGWGVIRAR